MLAEIVSTLSAIKNAMDIGKSLMTSKNLSEAEVKDAASKMFDTLIEARLKLVEAQDEIKEKANEIVRLSEALELKAKVTRKGDAYYIVDAEEKPKGVAYCVKCWEENKKLRSLVVGRQHANSCPTCQTMYARALSSEIKSPSSKE